MIDGRNFHPIFYFQLESPLENGEHMPCLVAVARLLRRLIGVLIKMTGLRLPL